MSDLHLQTKVELLTQNQQNLMEKLEEIIINNKEAHQDMVDMIIGIEAKLDKALEKKADKETQWSEQFILIVGKVIGVGLLTVLGGLIIKALIFFK